MPGEDVRLNSYQDPRHVAVDIKVSKTGLCRQGVAYLGHAPSELCLRGSCTILHGAMRWYAGWPLLCLQGRKAIDREQLCLQSGRH